MLLPNKIVSFSESVIPHFSIILNVLKQKDMTAKSLYEAVKPKVNDVGEFLEVLDSLYALGKINFNEEQGVLSYVNGDKVQ